MKRFRHGWAAGIAACATCWLGCNECGCSMFTQLNDEPTVWGTPLVFVDEPRLDGGAPSRTGYWTSEAGGLREFTTRGRAAELAIRIHHGPVAGACGSTCPCRTDLALTVANLDGDAAMTAGDPRVTSLTLTEHTQVDPVDGGTPPGTVVTATSASVTGTVAIHRVVGGAPGIEDDGMDLDLDLTFHMPDGRDRHIVMAVLWRYYYECFS